MQAEKGRDNILPKIMASSDNYDALFQVRLHVHQQVAARGHSHHGHKRVERNVAV